MEKARDITKQTRKGGQSKMKKRIFYLILATLVFLGIANKVEASSTTRDLYLNHLDFQAQINHDGSMKVTEKWNIKINDTNTLYKTFQTDKTKYSNISHVEVTDITNGNSKMLKQQNQWSYHLPKDNYFGGKNQDNEFEIAWGVGLEDRSATKIYEISYEVEDAIAKYSDYAELYWQFVGEEFEIDAKNITGTILLPEHSSSLEEIKVWGHTEDLNGEIDTTATNKIEFNINQFRSGRYVEVRTLFPTQMITSTSRGEKIERLEHVISEETTWANQANARREMKETTKKIMAIILNIGAIIFTIFSIKSTIKTIRNIKNSKKLKPTQEMEYYREMPSVDSTPTEALSLLTKQIGGFNNSIYLGRIFSATLLDLSLKKILAFTVNGKIITIQILEQEPKGLTSDELAIFEFLKEATKKTDNQLTTKELEKYIKKSSSKVLKLGVDIDTKTEQNLYQKELASKEGKKKKTDLVTYIILLAVAIPFLICGWVMLSVFNLVAIGILPLIVAVIVQLIVLSILASKTNVLTQKGIDEHAKWKGLKKYMEDFSLLDKREVPEIVIWEKFLVYATVFGIANKVLKQLKMVYPNLEEQLGTNHYGYMYLMLHTDFSNSFSNAITNSMSTAYSSATGGGGGFSGGGGGRTEDGRRRRRKIAFFSK